MIDGSTATAQVAAPGSKLNSYGRKAVFAAAVGYAMDGFDLLIISFVLTAIARTFQLSATQAAGLAWGCQPDLE